MQTHASDHGCLAEDEVLAFVGGELQDEHRGEVLAHVDACETCRTLVAALAHDGGAAAGDGAGAAAGDGAGAATLKEPPPAAEGPGSGADPILATDLIDSRFRLLKPLGRGAMATVYRAHDERLGIDVALKLLKKKASPNARAFAKELQVGRRVTHPNVCRLHDAGTAGDQAYITMELVEGETLAQLVDREELTWERAAGLLEGVAAGLAAAHVQGVVHRDIKPANVLVEASTGRAVLTDFGFAKHLDTKESRKRLIGTPAYWSPEQARGEPATPPSDVYSFGVLAYRLLAHRDLELNDASDLDDVPRAFRATIAKCLEMRPSDRFKDGAELLVSFRAAERRARTRWSRSRVGVLLGLAVALLGTTFYVKRATPPAADASPLAASAPPASALAASAPPASALSAASAPPANALAASAPPASALAASAPPGGALSAASAPPANALAASSGPPGGALAASAPPGGSALAVSSAPRGGGPLATPDAPAPASAPARAAAAAAPAPARPSTSAPASARSLPRSSAGAASSRVPAVPAPAASPDRDLLYVK